MFRFGGLGRRDPEKERLRAEKRAKEDAERAEDERLEREQRDRTYRASIAKAEAERQAAALRESELRARSKWNYREEVDAMRDITSSLAQLTSNDPVDLPFPWQGGTHCTITIIRSGARREVLVSAIPAQFQFGRMIYIISSRADSGSILEWSGNKTPNGRLDMMRLTQPEAFVRSFQRARHLVLEADFYNVGRRQFDFSPEGLDQRFT